MRCTDSLVLVAALATATLTAACNDDNEEPKQDPTFEAVVQDVLVPRCTFSSCHANPTVAASLDLSPEKACDTLISQPSCLFPDRMRIVPGRPEDSFFFHKLTGQGLNETPTGNCGGAQTNLLMPFGASELPDSEVALVHDWIAAGATCTGTGGKPPVNMGPAIASLTASTNTPLAGQVTSFTLTLDKAAPEGGQMVALEMDQNAMLAPVQVVVPATATSIRFEAYPLRPTSRFTLRARTGTSTKDIILRIVGLEIAEVLADPGGVVDDQLQWIKLHNRTPLTLDLSSYRLKSGQGNYDVVSVALSGSVPAGGCVVIGGPAQTAANGDPIYSQVVDFTPNLTHGGAQVTGFALFDSSAIPLNGIATPVDTMLIGTNNDAKMLGPDAEIATPSCDTPASGMSALRIPTGACMAATMQPRACN
jgi:hypothetical protein